MSAFGFFFGEVTLCGEATALTDTLNLCMREGVSYRAIRKGEDSFWLVLSPRDAKALLETCGGDSLSLAVIKKVGLPYLFYRYRRRVGLLVGGILMAALMMYASRVVWDIRVTGNERLHETAVEELLASYGLTVGRYIPSLELDVLEARLLLENPDIAWVSIHPSGTTVNVELRETVRGKGAEAGETANLVASVDGLIERIEAYDGKTLVKVGDTVRAGDLLVSGVYDNTSGGLRMTRATGAIYARTVHDYTVEVPFEYEKKVYTGMVSKKNSIFFFGKEIKLFRNSRNEGESCDIIYYRKFLSLPGGKSIPIGVDTVQSLPYTVERARYSEEEVMNEAFYRLSMTLSDLSEEAELLSKNITFEMTDESYILRCRVVCIENIAVRQKIQVGS